MTLAVGEKLGPYEILSPLGAGGMGEVYRARDSRLGREIAIKVLPAELSGDAERRARFEQEARSASALNHPNIVTLYDIGTQDGALYIAMELVEGRSLREVLSGEPLPFRKLMEVAVQMADGLSKAHAAGIVHRDLKPDNVMVSRQGFAKILDFGLAKLAQVPAEELSNLPTMDGPATRPGTVLGTVGYMSPEQASGQSVDFRSDQFSFGSILYEMATGKRAFLKRTGVETLSAIIREEPESVARANPKAPAPLRWIVERCLAKDPDDRYASTRDLARDLANVRDRASEVSIEAVPVALARRLGWLGPALIGGALLAAALTVVAVLRARQATPVQPVQFSVAIPAGTTYMPSPVSRGFSVSPDGTRLVIEAMSKGRRRLYLRRLDSEKAVEIEGSLDASSHFWSPDGRFIAFYADGKLKKIPAEGGGPEELCEAPFAVVGTWSSSGTILFVSLDAPGIYRVPDSGGQAVRIVSPESSGQLPLWPHFLQDGRRFLYLGGQGAPGDEQLQGTLRATLLDSKEDLSVAPLKSRFEYAPPGYLLYVRDSALFAQPFDERRARFQGEPRLLVPNVLYFYGPRHAAFSASRTGVLAYQTAARPSRLVWLSREGREVGKLGEPAVVRGLQISGDGAKVAVDIEVPTTGTSDIWVFEPARGVSTRLHSDPVDEVMPVWSPDGSKVMYRSDRKGPPDIFEIAPEIPGSEKPVLVLPGVQQPADISPDGRLLAYLNDIGTTVWNIWLFPLDGNGKPVAWLPTRFNQTSPRFSPDGRWIAYESDETGNAEVYVALAQGAGEKQRISPAGGREPRWRRDGKELYYVAPGNSVMTVAVNPAPHWEPAAPRLLFRLEEEIENWDVFPDGSRFLVKLPAEKERGSPLHVILNWPALLKSQG